METYVVHLCSSCYIYKRWLTVVVSDGLLGKWALDKNPGSCWTRVLLAYRLRNILNLKLL